MATINGRGPGLRLAGTIAAVAAWLALSGSAAAEPGLLKAVSKDAEAVAAIARSMRADGSLVKIERQPTTVGGQVLQVWLRARPGAFAKTGIYTLTLMTDRSGEVMSARLWAYKTSAKHYRFGDSGLEGIYMFSLDQSQIHQNRHQWRVSTNYTVDDRYHAFYWSTGRLSSSAPESHLTLTDLKVLWQQALAVLRKAVERVPVSEQEVLHPAYVCGPVTPLSDECKPEPVKAATAGAGEVPLHPVHGLRLMSGNRTVHPALSTAIRPSDGNVLAAWSFSPSPKSDGFVEARQFDADGRPMGQVLRVDAAPPTISGYHYVAGDEPHVAYSPASDSWVVVFTGEYVQDAPCPNTHVGQKLLPACADLAPIMSVRIDASGQIVGGPNILVQEPTAAQSATLTCRTDGCVVVWPQCWSLGECTFGSHPASVVALPLDANGNAMAQSPTKISTGLCEPRGYVNNVGPDAPTVSPTDAGYIVSWHPATGPTPISPDCIVLRAIGPSGSPSGPEVTVSRRPVGLRSGVTPVFSDQQTCSFQGGKRVLVTWLVGEATSRRPVSGDLQSYGLYGQVFASNGKLVGQDTRGIRSFNDVPLGQNAREAPEPKPEFSQTSVSDTAQDKCVVLATSLNKVDAYVYDPSGRLNQRVNLLQYHRPAVGELAESDVVSAAWSQDGAFLLDLHTQRATDPFTLLSYGLGW